MEMVLKRLLNVIPQAYFDPEKSMATTITHLKSPNREVRLSALTLVADGKLSEALEAVIALIRDPAAEVRALAAFTLNKLNAPRSHARSHWRNLMILRLM